MIKILLSLLFCMNAYSNPFSVIVKSDLLNYSGEEYYELLITIRSISKNQGKYLFKVDFPKNSIELIEGKKNYRDELKGLGEKKYSVVINALEEHEGEIKVTVYSYKNEWAIDTNNKRIFLSKYKIAKNNKDKLILSVEDVIEFIRTSKKNKKVNTNKFINDDKTEISEDEDIEEKNTQKFLFVKESKTLNIVRYIMLFFSVCIIGYFIYRLRKK